MLTSTIMQMACARIDESDPANPISVTNTEVLYAVNQGYLLSSLLTLFAVKAVDFPLNGCFYTPLDILPDFLVPLRITVNGVRLRPSTLTELDGWDPAWQARTGTPARYVTVGSNLLAVTPWPQASGGGTTTSPSLPGDILPGGTLPGGGVTSSGGGTLSVTARMTYAYSPAPLAASDTPMLPAQYHPALVSWTSYRLRAKEGAQSLSRGLGDLNVFLDACQELGDWVRNRSAAAAYDTLPIEMKLLDRSKLIDSILKRQAKQAAVMARK